jgi:hypothetical protein
MDVATWKVERQCQKVRGIFSSECGKPQASQFREFSEHHNLSRCGYMAHAVFRSLDA